MNKIRYYLYGAGGHAKVIGDMIAGSGLTLVSAVDKNMARTKLLDKYPVYSTLNNVSKDEDSLFIVAVGNNFIRKRIVEKELNAWSFGTIISNNALVSKFAEVEEGSVVMPGATINVDVHIGKHCIINTNASIDHECVIEDFVHVSPNVALAGNVEVGEGTHVGIGSSVIQGIKIGKWCTIGAGSVIIRDIPDFAVVVGNPGRIIKYNNQ